MKQLFYLTKIDLIVQSLKEKSWDGLMITTDHNGSQRITTDHNGSQRISYLTSFLFSSRKIPFEKPLLALYSNFIQSQTIHAYSAKFQPVFYFELFCFLKLKLKEYIYGI